MMFNMDKNIAEAVQEILKHLELEVPDIEASAVVSAEGFPIASALPRNIDEARIGAITAAMLTMGERAAMEFSKGDLHRIIIHGSEGILLSLAAGEDAVLTISATHGTRLGILLLYAERAAKDIEKIIKLD